MPVPATRSQYFVYFADGVNMVMACATPAKSLPMACSAIRDERHFALIPEPSIDARISVTNPAGR
jgi:hypothetical protein